jgi:hypothetical protein
MLNARRIISLAAGIFLFFAIAHASLMAQTTLTSTVLGIVNRGFV